MGFIARTITRTASGRSLVAFCAVSVVAAACGSLLGYLFGYLVLQQRAEIVADQFDLRIQSVARASIQEEFSVLEKLKDSPYAFCSDADLAWMRMLLFHADYLNEVARMHDGSMLCSATLGRVAAGSRHYDPNLVLRHGILVYLNPAPYQRPNLTILGVQKDDSLVVFRPAAQTFFRSAPLHFAVTMLDEQGRPQGPLLGNLQPVPAWILTQPTKTRWKDTILATRCDTQLGFCTTSGLSVATAMSWGRFGVSMTTGFGGILGAFIPLLSSFDGARRRAMAWQLRRAIRNGALQVVYMPVVNLCDRRVVGAEALVRWNDAEGRPVSPEIFVRLAEERGFIDELTELVVCRVLGEFGVYLNEHPEFCISVNATATDFANPHFLHMLSCSLENASVAPQNLNIEITESSTARHHVIRDTIHQLRRHGIEVHIDDFGTGYSSLAYLHELCVDAIKIDKSFTQAIGTSAVTVAILPQIMAMADALDLAVIVEGIETEEQAAYFTASATPRRGQGWLFGAPVPASTFARIHLRQETLDAAPALAD